MPYWCCVQYIEGGSWPGQAYEIWVVVVCRDTTQGFPAVAVPAVPSGELVARCNSSFTCYFISIIVITPFTSLFVQVNSPYLIPSQQWVQGEWASGHTVPRQVTTAACFAVPLWQPHSPSPAPLGAAGGRGNQERSWAQEEGRGRVEGVLRF